MQRVVTMAVICFVGLGLLWQSRPRVAAPSGQVSVAYHLTWDAEGITRAADGSWEVTNAQGYRVRLQEGYLVSYSLQLMQPPAPSQPGSGVATARAGHSGELDPLACEMILVESLLTPEAHAVGMRSGEPGRFDKLHYLVARGNEETQTPGGEPLKGVSLRIAGAFQAPGNDAWQPFQLKTSMANGVQAQLGQPLDLPQGATVSVTLQRNLRTLFDGVPFDAFSERTAGWMILHNLMQNCEVQVQHAD